MGKRRSEPVTIIGAGAVGVACALHLRKCGEEVLLVDAEGPATGASSGNAGSISTGSVVPVAVPGMLGQIPGWLIDPTSPLAVRWRYLPKALPWLIRWVLASSSRQARAGAAAIAPLTLGALDAWREALPAEDRSRYLRSNGQLLVSRSGEIGESDRFALALRRENGVRVDVVGRDELRQLEAELAPDYQWGFFLPDSGHLTDPQAAIRALFRQFVQLGGIHRIATVTGLVRGREGTVEALRCSEGEMEVDRLVVAAGAYSGRFARLIGDRVPLDTERGYNATIRDPGVEVSRPVSDMNRRFFATTMDHGLRIAGTVEIAGLDAPPNFGRAQALLEDGKRMFPGLRFETFEPWMGRRPSLPDSLPVIGRSPRAGNVWYAFGHGHIGLTTAPTTASLVAKLMSDPDAQLEDNPYRPERFERR